MRPWHEGVGTAFVTAALLFVLSILGGKVRAEERSAEALIYERTVQRGVQEMAFQNYLEARSLFLEAHKLFPNARTFRALGMVEYELRNYVAALGYLEQALKSDSRPLDPEKRAQVEQLRKEANSFVARCELRIKPASAVVEIDGEPVRENAREILLQVGNHDLQVSAAGFNGARRQIGVTGAGTTLISVTLVPLAVEAARADPASDANHGDASNGVVGAPSRGRRLWWLWTGIGLVAAGVAAGLTLTLTSDRTQREAPYGGSAMTALKGPS